MPVVGIGASAGGIKAMKEFFSRVRRAALSDATLHVESAPGRGTSVHLRRPIVHRPAS